MFGNLILALSYNAGNAIQWVIMSLMLAVSVALIVVVMMQKSSGDDSVSAVTGGSSDSFYGKNKSQTKEGLLRKLTIAFAIAIFVLSVVFFIVAKNSGLVA